MSPEQFTYWLQGYAELQQTAPSNEQWQIIRDHLELVLEKKTPQPQPLLGWQVGTGIAFTSTKPEPLTC